MTASDRRPLGRSHVRVSRLGLGTATLGALPPDQDATAIAVIRHAVASGVCFIDTAPRYGFGRAEERVGRALAGLDGDTAILSTKVGLTVKHVSTATKVRGILLEAARDPRAGVGLIGSRAGGVARRLTGRHPEGNLRRAWPDATFDPSFDGVMRSVEDSLRRLGTDRVDLLLIHEPEGPLGLVMDGAYRALERLRAERMIGAIGVGGNDPDVLAAYARAGDFDCLLVGSGYTLMDARAGRSLLPLAQERGISVLIGGPFASGILAEPSPGALVDHRPATMSELAFARRLAAIAGDHGISLKAAALQFPFRHPAVVSVIFGATSIAEVDEDLTLAAAPIPEAFWGALASDGLVA